MERFINGLTNFAFKSFMLSAVVYTATHYDDPMLWLCCVGMIIEAVTVRFEIKYKKDDSEDEYE